MAKNKVSINIDMEDVYEVLKDRIANGDEKNAEELAKIICGCLSKSDHNIELIYNALLGKKLIIPYKVGDIVMVHENGLSTWNFDKEATVKAGIIVNSVVKAKITNIDKYEWCPYVIEHEAITSKGTKEIKTTNVRESAIVKLKLPEKPRNLDELL